MAAFSSWRRCLGCFPSWKSSSLTAAIKDRNSPTRWQKFFPLSTLKSSGDPTPQSASRSYLNAGSSNAPSLGSIAAGGSPRIGRTSIARRLHSCASLQFASCSENSVIRPKVSGQTPREEDSSPRRPKRWRQFPTAVEIYPAQRWTPVAENLQTKVHDFAHE